MYLYDYVTYASTNNVIEYTELHFLFREYLKSPRTFPAATRSCGAPYQVAIVIHGGVVRQGGVFIESDLMGNSKIVGGYFVFRVR